MKLQRKRKETAGDSGSVLTEKFDDAGRSSGSRTQITRYLARVSGNITKLVDVLTIVVADYVVCVLQHSHLGL